MLVFIYSNLSSLYTISLRKAFPRMCCKVKRKIKEIFKREFNKRLSLVFLVTFFHKLQSELHKLNTKIGALHKKNDIY